MTVEQLPRRQFLRGKFLNTLQSEQDKTQGLQAIRLPWAVENNEFIAGCSRCGDCIEVCETQILVKGDGGYPEVQFTQGECTFCQRCVNVCQQPIFRPVTEPAWWHKIDILSTCLTQQKVACRRCEDSCETRAIRFTPVLANVAQPRVHLADCTGCGACVQYCPVSAVAIMHHSILE